MATTTGKRPKRKRAGQYHHGDLQRALVDQALRIIQAEGVEGLTLREVGAMLGVSRTALYRHFADKQALLAAVGREGFRTLRQALAEVWEERGGDLHGFEAMGVAYVEFARTHPSHYRVMFGRFVDSCARDPGFVDQATAAFQVLMSALVELQQAGLVRRDDPLLQARFVWSVVHGIAMLVIDGQLRGVDERGETLIQYANERLRDALKQAEQ